MFYISGTSVRTAVDFLIKNGWKKGLGLCGKAFKFAGIKYDNFKFNYE